ncbi:MAG TPA: DUF5715 family protein [Longimicrobiaceae bacterium]|nr:DUF5715 family protein [Longimicrobiaceae bacterium]
MRLHPILLALPLLAGALHAPHADAQTLRGSRGAVDRAYRKAHDHDLTFFRNGTGVRSAVNRGDLVKLRGNADFRIHQVTYPYVLPTTVTFVKRLAEQYRDHCGEKMVVTSAVRPRSFRLANSVDKSVHPTGMAIDIRKPTRARCAGWLRETLLALEGNGVLDATEERRPPHFHVAVFPQPYMAYLGRRPDTAPAASGSSRKSASASSSSGAAERKTHRVKRGETLSHIARRHGTSVARIKSANSMRSSRIKPGQVLRLPASR